MDGRRQAAQLEVHEVKLAVALVLLPALAGAQQRRQVYVAGANGQQGAVFEFRPCIPAEGSDCGAWIDHMIDSSVTVTPIRAARSSDGRDSLWIDGGAVRIRSLRAPKSEAVVRDKRGAATSLAVSASGRTAYVVLEDAAPAPNYVVMIDLETRSAIASAPFRFSPGGVGVVRR